MDKLSRWLQRKNYDICFDTVNMVIFKTEHKGTVYINSKSKKAIQLISMMHECGHVIIHQMRTKNPKKRIYGCTLMEWLRRTGRCKKKKTSAIATLDEEINAWELGERLSKRLKIKYNKKKFELDRVKSLMTYVRAIV